jgi:hypothetical protein
MQGNITRTVSARALRRRAVKETARWLSANIRNPLLAWPRKPIVRPVAARTSNDAACAA